MNSARFATVCVAKRAEFAEDQGVMTVRAAGSAAAWRL
ncbi:hypothetical protein MPNTM1_05027 [Mycolicibacterium parafortuitum]